MYGLPFWNFDMRFGKATQIKERIKLGFSADFFNIFNHPQYGEPISDINYGSPAPGTVSSYFGEVNSTVNNPRLVQFALKLSF